MRVASKYKQKVAARRRVPVLPKEPQDDYSVIPSIAVRKYFRAKAGMYGMTTRSYRAMRVEVSPYIFKRLLHGAWMKVRIVLSPQTAEALGELARDVLRLGRHPNINVYNVSFGGRMHVKVMDTIETHSPSASTPELTLVVFGFAASSRALRMEWTREGLSVSSV